MLIYLFQYLLYGNSIALHTSNYTSTLIERNTPQYNYITIKN